MSLDLTPFEKALISLEEVLLLPATPVIRDSTIQRFEYTYELAFKILKRYLEMSSTTPAEIDSKTFKEILRLAAEQGLIDSPEAWFIYRKARNETSHGYDEKKAVVVYNQIGDFAKSARVLWVNLSQRVANL